MATKAHNQDDLRERSTGELVKQLSEQSSTLVRQEVELAKPSSQRRPSTRDWAAPWHLGLPCWRCLRSGP